MGAPCRRRLLLGWVSMLSVVAAACGGSDGAITPSPLPPTSPQHTVQAITDGDTIRLTAPFMGATSVRMVNIDAAELGGSSQEPWASAAREALRVLVPVGSGVHVETGADPIDGFGRVLGVLVRPDGTDVNRELLRQGQVVTYFIWPNVDRFSEYRLAQIEAQRARRGVWSDPPLGELPFEYRQRTGGDAPFRPVGDALTRFYVDAGDYRRVHVNNRVFFASQTAAGSAGYTRCPRVGADYASSCFADGR